jgi:chorismate dehydratase
MVKIRISAVKYANTYPFIYGMTESGFDKKVVLETDHPADCAAKLLSGRVDIGLIPVAALTSLMDYNIISDYCIGANGEVRTVMLLSNSPFNEVDTIYLDYRSRSSVNLTKILARDFWKKEYQWINTSESFDFKNVGRNEAVVLIGDQCFEYENSYLFRVDLALEWKKFTGLPFVFACWVSNRRLEKEFINEFNKALETGVSDIDAVVEKMGQSGIITGKVLKDYLTKNIDYNFDENKKKGMNLFLELLKTL